MCCFSFHLCLDLLAVLVDFLGPEPKEVLNGVLNPLDLGDSVLNYGFTLALHLRISISGGSREDGCILNCNKIESISLHSRLAPYAFSFKFLLKFPLQFDYGGQQKYTRLM